MLPDAIRQPPVATPFQVRPLVPGDVDGLAASFPEGTLGGLAEDLAAQERGEISLLGAWHGPQVIGRGGIDWRGPRSARIAAGAYGPPEIFGLEVAHAFRSRGVGLLLLRRLEELAQDRGHRSVGLGVALDNARARALYRRRGYDDSGRGVYHQELTLGASPARPARVREVCHFWIKPLPEPCLVLFDIDGTLLTSQGAGRDAMCAAGQSLFGGAFGFADVEVYGRLDPLIWRDLARANGAPPAQEPAFRARYRAHLEERLRVAGAVQALPGVSELLVRLGEVPGLVRGILSGNYPETGRLKLLAGGLDPGVFTVCAWGDDAASRPELVEVARRRHGRQGGRAVSAEGIVVIGDTPLDVACALANGCRVLAVATGQSSVAELAAAEADRVVESLADVDAIVAWITAGSRRA